MGTPNRATTELLSYEAFPGYLKDRKSLPKYDASAEPKLPHPWWELDRAGIDRQLRELAALLLKALQGAPESDKELEHLLRTVASLSKVERSPAIKVALVGAQGAGKSLLTNALFGCDGLSLTGADGSACTAAIITYAHYPGGEADDRLKFFADVRLLKSGQKEALISEHAKSWHLYYDDDDDEDDEDGAGPKKTTQDEHDRRAKDTAEEFFISIFGSRQKFLDCWSFNAYKSGEFTNICNNKCEEAIAKLDLTSQKINKFSGTDQKHLIERIKPYLTKVKDRINMWPLVDGVNISFADDLLEQGIEIIDVPGWGDLNLSRVRNAERVRENADVEIMLADTIRIASDDAVINNARASVTMRGATNVKLVATKIDSITTNQLNQCSGEPYDRIKEMLRSAEAEMQQAEEDDDLLKKDTSSKFKAYLERQLKLHKIDERKGELTSELAVKFQERSRGEGPQVFHASASDYMDWIKKPKILFSDQPALSPQMTGIPAIRQFLYSLPAQKNLKDYTIHINVLVPAFVEKVKRAISQSDRDTGFSDLADEFDVVRQTFVTSLLSQAKDAFSDISKNSLAKTRVEADVYKKQVNRIVTQHWFSFPGRTFDKVLKCRGFIPKGVSQAKGLKEGCNLNEQLSQLLAPGFHKWYAKHSDCMKIMKPALSKAFEQAHNKTITMMNNSSASLVVVEKAKKKWLDVGPKLEAKLMVLMATINRLEKRSLFWATMEDKRESSLIATITDSVFDAVFAAAPAIKTITTGKNKGKQTYVSPKVQFQRKIMSKLILQPDNHLVDAVIARFQSEFNQVLNGVLDEHFADIDKLLGSFSEVLRNESPLNYTISPIGEDIRKELEQLIPTLEAKVEELKVMIPAKNKTEDEVKTDTVEISTENEGDTVSAIYDKMRKRKRKQEICGSNLRVKKE